MHTHIMQKTPTKSEKISYLRAERVKLMEKVKFLRKNFRGVHHEDSASEMKYTTLKVYEAHLQSIEDELRSYGEKVEN